MPFAISVLHLLVLLDCFLPVLCGDDNWGKARAQLNILDNHQPFLFSDDNWVKARGPTQHNVPHSSCYTSEALCYPRWIWWMLAREPALIWNAYFDNNLLVRYAEVTASALCLPRRRSVFRCCMHATHLLIKALELRLRTQE